MGSWRQVAAELLSNPTKELVTSRFGLPVQVESALLRLDRVPPPRILRRGEWRMVVEDALRIARDGWASSAMGLGWSMHDLFGIGPIDDWEFSGLAVWLRGRPLVLLDEHRAIASAGDHRFAFERGGIGHGKAPVVDPVLLWDFGR